MGLKEELNWYVVRVVSAQEKKIKSYLDTEILRNKYQEHIPEVLIPIEKVYEMRNGKKRIRERNFFPGYILVQADIEYGEVLHIIKSIPGVIGFLGSEEKGAPKIPTPLRQSEVKRILGKVDEVEEENAEIDVSFIVGESVKVMDGPFKGFNGTIQEVFEDKKKLNVVVKIFGRNQPVELNYIEVEKDS